MITLWAASASARFAFRFIQAIIPGASIPHFHVFIGRGSLAIELLCDGTARISHVHGEPDTGHLTKRDIQIILATAEAAHEELLALWEASR